MNKKIKAILVMIGLFGVLAMGLIVYFFIDNSMKTSRIKFVIAPMSADINLNGKKFSNMEEHRLKPGEYSLSVTKEGFFEPYFETFSIGDGETRNFYIELQVIEGTNWYKDHPEDGYSLDAIISERLNRESESLLSRYPLLSSLPITVEYYKNNTDYVYYVISYDMRDNGSPIIVVKDYTGGNYEEALNRIILEGYRLEDYHIEYEDKSANFSSGKAPDD